MEEIYLGSDGKEYSASDLQEYASQLNLDFEEYLQKFQFTTKTSEPGKSKPTSPGVPVETIAAPDMESSSEDTSSESPQRGENFIDKPPGKYITLNINGKPQDLTEEAYNREYAGNQEYPNSFDEYVSELQKNPKFQNLKIKDFQQPNLEGVTVVGEKPTDGYNIDVDPVKVAKGFVMGGPVGLVAGAISGTTIEKDKSIEEKVVEFQDGLLKIDEESEKEKIVKQYFNLSTNAIFGIPVARNPEYSPQTVERKATSQQGKDYNERMKEEDLQKSLGAKKYEQWKKITAQLQSNNEELTLENIAESFNVNEAKQTEKEGAEINNIVFEGKQNYARNYITKNLTGLGGDVDSRVQYLLDGLGEGFKDELNFQKNKSQQDRIDFEKNFGRPLVRTEVIDGRKYEPEGVTSTFKNVFENTIKKLENNKDSLTATTKRLEGKFKEMNYVQEKYGDKIKIAQENGDYEQVERLKQNPELLASNETLISLQEEGKVVLARWQEAMDIYEKIPDSQAALNQLSKNYNLFDRFLHKNEQAFLGSAAMYLGKSAEWSGNLLNLIPGVNIESNGDLAKAATDYNKALQIKDEKQFPKALNVFQEDLGWYSVTEALVNNSPSIIALALFRGGGSTKGLNRTREKLKNFGKVSNLPSGNTTALNRAFAGPMAAFFTMEAGGQASNLEISQREAQQNINFLEAKLESTEGEFDKNEIYQEISNQKNILNLEEWQKALNVNSYGGIATLAERFGTLRSMQRFSRMSRAVGLNNFRKLTGEHMGKVISQNIGTLKGFTIAAGTEIIEETFTQIGHNYVDNKIGINKSLIEGLNPEFFKNVLVPTVAILGPSVSTNIYNSVSSTLKTQAEQQKNRQLEKELIDIQLRLNKIDGRTTEGRKLKKERDEKMKESAFFQMVSLGAKADMSKEDHLAAFDIEAEKGRREQEAYDAGLDALSIDGAVDNYSRNRMKYLKDDIAELDKRKEKIFKNYNDEYLTRIAKDDKEGSERRGEKLFNLGMYNFSKSLLKATAGVNVNTINTSADLLEFESKLKRKDYLALEEALQSGLVTASHVGNEIFIFEDNYFKNQGNEKLSKTEREVASVAALHELGHIQAKNAGIIKDDKLVGDARSVITGIIADVKSRYESGRLSKEQYNTFNSRIKGYRDTEGKYKHADGRTVVGKEINGVDVDELIQLVADFKTLGILPKSSFNNLYSLKALINNFLSLKNPSRLAFKINTAEDVNGFINSWQSKAASATDVQQIDKEEEVKFSKTLFETIDSFVPKNITTKAQYDAFTRSLEGKKLFESIYTGAISANIRKDRSVQEAEKVIQSVVTRVLGFNPEQVRKDGTIVGREGFVERVMSDTRFATLDAKEALAIESKKRKKEDNLDESAAAERSTMQLADESTSVEFELDNKKKEDDKPIFSDALELSEDTKQEIAVATAKSFPLVKKGVNKTYYITKKETGKVITVTEEQYKKLKENKNYENPRVESKITNYKSYKQGLQKLSYIQLKPTINKLVKTMGFEKFVDKYFNVIYNKLPQSVINKRYSTDKLSSSTFIGKKTGRETIGAGKAITEKVKVNKTDFINYFVNREMKSATRSDRQTALIEVIINELSADVAIDIIEGNIEVKDKGKELDVLALMDVSGFQLENTFYDKLEKALERDNLSVVTLDDKNKKSSNIKFSKTIGEAREQGMNEQDLYKFVKLAKASRNKAQRKNPELMQAFQDDIEETSWRGYEQRGFLNFVLANKDNPEITIDQKEITAESNTKIDLRFEWKGQKLGMEIRKGIKGAARYNGGRARGTTLNNLTTEYDYINEIIKSKKFKSTVGKALKKWQEELQELSDKKIQFFKDTNGVISGTTDFVSREVHEQMKKKGLQQAVSGGVKFPIDMKHIRSHSINMDKNGYKGAYMLINTEGFSLANDPLNTSAPLLEGEAYIEFKIKWDPKKASGETRSESSEGNYAFAFEARIESLKNKGIPLASLNDYEKVFERSISQKEILETFNNIIEKTKGVPANQDITPTEMLAFERKNKQLQIWIPSAAEDLRGLIYRLVRKGKLGDQDLKFYDEVLFKPLAHAYAEFENDKNESMNTISKIRKAIKAIGVDLQAEAFDGITNGQAVRLHLWNTRGYIKDNKLKGVDAISDKLGAKATNHIRSLKGIELLDLIADIEGVYQKTGRNYPEPKKQWRSQTILFDFLEFQNEDRRKEIFAGFVNNMETLFGKLKNGKLEGPQAMRLRAAVGNQWMISMSDMVRRLKSGRNRIPSKDPYIDAMLDWTNASVGTTMFINSRSAFLQTISNLNFINGTDNNVLKVGAAYLNTPQFVEDFLYILNSPFLQQRRAGLKIDVNLDELSQAVDGYGKTGKAQALISAILKKGFMPTQFADSFAIAFGGAPFLRNRTKTYIKEGLTKEEAFEKAFLDMKETSDMSQQSSRPDKVSMQQASSLGKLILSFQNYPMQAARLQKRAAQDFFAGRGDKISHFRKIIYYGVVQNAAFHMLQKAAFAVLFNDEGIEDEEEEKRLWSVLNGMADTMLAGSGFAGMGMAMMKNVTLELIDEFTSDKPADTREALVKATSFSPAINAKFRKFDQALKRWEYKDTYKDLEKFSLKNPILKSTTELIEFSTNFPSSRIISKLENVEAALDAESQWYEKVFLMMGWNKYSLFMEDWQMPDITPITPAKIKSRVQAPKIKGPKIKKPKIN